MTPPETTSSTLPHDVEACHALIESLVADLEDYKKRVDFLVRRLFGAKSEKLDPNQLVFAELGVEPAPEEVAAAEEAPVAKPRKRNGHGRQKLAKDLPRKRIEHDITEVDKVCPKGHQRVRIGEDISEQLEYTPASYYVIEHVLPVYACPVSDCDCGVVQAVKPAQPIEKGLAGPGLLAHVITSKYCDHQPLHRQERIIARHGVHLSRKTLCDWVLQSAQILKPIVDAMRTEVLQSKVIHTDDTPVRVQDKNKNRTTHKAYLWPYLGDADHPYTVFDYTPTRNREGPETFLESFRGTQTHPRYIQCDAYPGYNGLFDTPSQRHLYEVACWAHARRKFFDAKTSDPVRANQVLLAIGKLYEVEREAKERDPVAHLALRKDKAKPLLEDIKETLIAYQRNTLPKSPLGQATSYALSNWDALVRYSTDGDLAIDNNPAEQAIRAIALGRKNWLFLGSDRGGTAAAIHFSLIASARRHGLDPFAYLQDLLQRIPTHPNRKIAELFPNCWKAANE